LQNPNDPLSYLCAWLALVPQALCVVYATLIWSTREAEVALMFAGQLGCEAVNFLLKRLIKEERPRRIHLTGKGYGMPSSHAQFAFFWAVALALFLLVRHKPRGRATTKHSGNVAVAANGNGKGQVAGSAGTALGNNWTVAVELYTHQPWSFAERALVSAAAFGVAGMVAWSRVYLDYHTPKQVMVGCAAGALSALAWFVATWVVREIGLLAWALEIPLARWMRLRDLVVEEDLCQAGWEKWEGIRAARRETKTK
jgi:dolichyldiphosphatase